MFSQSVLICRSQRDYYSLFDGTTSGVFENFCVHCGLHPVLLKHEASNSGRARCFPVDECKFSFPFTEKVSSSGDTKIATCHSFLRKIWGNTRSVHCYEPMKAIDIALILRVERYLGVSTIEIVLTQFMDDSPPLEDFIHIR